MPDLSRIEEIRELRRELEERAGKKLDRRRLTQSIADYTEAWRAFQGLLDKKRRLEISAIWCLTVANAFMLDDVRQWTRNVHALLSGETDTVTGSWPKVFLAGAPIAFPNLKVLELIEKAGMHVAADELCTCDRNLPTPPGYDDPSLDGMIRALAERSHLSCVCPTFIDNDHRLRNMLHVMREHDVKGMVYHILRGCHPYDLDSFAVETAVKNEGRRFVKIDTDFSHEDKQNILTRLEAFRNTLT